jgi:catechol 2,3-dioxygenase-like lactoylglutathione lyase family enzyme
MIAVADVEASSRWYQRVLGCVSGHGGPYYERLVTKAGALILQLHQWNNGEDDHENLDRPEKGTRPGRGVLLWFETEDLDAAAARAKDLRAEIIEDVHMNPNAGHREIWLRDLDGYVVVIAGPEEA